MQENSGDELLRKLSNILRQQESLILSGESKLCLTVTSVIYMNRCFEQLNSGSNRQIKGERHYNQASSPCVAYLHDLTKNALSIKLIPGPCARFDTLLSISHFKNLQYLEIKKVPLGYITGLQSLRNQIRGLTCMHSAFALNQVFLCCGGDLSSTPFAWQNLKEVTLSYNRIDHLDDSVKVLPVIEVLNLSHNNISSPEEEDCWQFLTGLRYLNLGYNQLYKVPSLPVVSITRFQLKILILRNNNIQNLRGIQHFGLLEILDVANNCITSFHELFSLAHLHNLSVLHLSGNPVCFHDEYRIKTVSCLSPVPHQGEMYLDNQKLSPLEKSFVGSSVQPASLLSYLPYQPAVVSPRNMSPSADSSPVHTESPNDLVDQPLVVPQNEKKKKVRKLRTRQISINKDVDEESKNSITSSTSSQVEPSLDHTQDIERLEKARDLGGAYWLPAINNVLHGETTSTQSRSSLYQDDESDVSSTSPYVVSQEAVTVDLTSPLSRKSSSNESYKLDEDINQPFIVTLKSLHLPEEEQEEDCDLLVTITEHFIRERDCGNGKVTCKLELGSLLAANIEEPEDGEFVVHLKFSYLSKERKERYYIMEDRESAEQLIGLLFPMIMPTEETKTVMTSEHLQCLKCSAYFTEQTSKSRDHYICPDCGSTQIIEVNPVEKPDQLIENIEGKPYLDGRTDVTTGNTWLIGAQKIPDLIPHDSNNPTISSQPDIYTYNNENISQKSAESTGNLPEQKRYAISNTEKYKINNCDNYRADDKTMRNDDIDTEQNGTLSWREHENTMNKNAGFVVPDKSEDSAVNSASPSRNSALSNSIKEFESKSLLPKSFGNGIEPGRRRVIDTPISLKTSSLNTPSTPDSSYPRQETTSSKKPSPPRQQMLPLASSPTQPNVILNLFSKLSNKMSGPLLSSSLKSTQVNESGSSRAVPAVASCLGYKISPDEFKDCDHRLKLYFEVSLFVGGSDESLSCLIKAPVVAYSEIEEMCALLVISNTAVYICKLVETAGFSANECLSLISSYSLEELQNVDFGVFSQSFRLEFNGESPACYTFYVRDKDRCEAFLHLLIKSANFFRAQQEMEPLKTTRTNPQTIAHIRSQVLGVQHEDLSALGERYLEQLTYFTEPPLIKDRKSLLRNYSSCFVGREFIDWLIRYGEVRTRQQGVELAQNLVDGGVIEHVSKESRFEDKDQFYRFIANEGKTEKSASNGEEDVTNEIEMTLSDVDTHLSLVMMAYRILDVTNPSRDMKPVTIVVTTSHIAFAEENPQWPFPRYIDSAPTVNGPQFHCIGKYKMTDVTSLEFFSDSPCHVAIVISEEDGPHECAENYVLFKTETTASLSSLVKVIKEPWEEQFGVELQMSLIPSLEKDPS